MARDGLGTYSLPAGNPVDTRTTISSTTHNNTMNDLAAALTQSVSKDGQTTMTGTLNMGTNAISGVTKLTITGGVVGPVLSVSAPSSGTTASLTSVATGIPLSLTDGTVTATATFAGTAFSIGPTSAHTLNLATNGSNRVVVTSAGNVTINGVASGNSLTVNGSTAAQAGLLIQAGSGASAGFNRAVLRLISQAGTAGWYLWNYGDSSDKFSISTASGTDVFTITQAGNVTVNAPSSGVATVINGLTTVNTLQLGSTGAASIVGFSWNTGLAGGAWNIYTQSTDPLAVGTAAAAGFSLYTNAAARIAIAGGGAVTINNPASSGAALVVNGSASTPANSIGSSGTAFTLDCSKSNVHYVTMTGNVAAGSLTISNIQDGQTVNLYLTQDGTGSRTLGNPTGVKWPGGVPSPILSTAASAIDCITFQRQNSITTATVLRAFA